MAGVTNTRGGRWKPTARWSAYQHVDMAGARVGQDFAIPGDQRKATLRRAVDIRMRSAGSFGGSPGRVTDRDQHLPIQFGQRQSLGCSRTPFEPILDVLVQAPVGASVMRVAISHDEIGDTNSAEAAAAARIASRAGSLSFSPLTSQRSACVSSRQPPSHGRRARPPISLLSARSGPRLEQKSRCRALLQTDLAIGPRAARGGGAFPCLEKTSTRFSRSTFSSPPTRSGPGTRMRMAGRIVRPPLTMPVCAPRQRAADDLLELAERQSGRCFLAPGSDSP